MLTIVLAAGQSKRFQVEGYKIPKPFLDIEWRGVRASMLDHVLNTIPAQLNPIRVAVPDSYDKTYKFQPFDRISFTGVGETRGPAESLLKIVMKPFFSGEESLLIMDSDILNHTNDLWELANLQTSGVLVRKSANPAYSYVDALGEFQIIMEKSRISEWAVSGAYFIHESDRDDFVYQLDNISKNSVKEPYISHAILLMERRKMTSLAVTYDPIDWGTPQDVLLSGARICT